MAEHAKSAEAGGVHQEAQVTLRGKFTLDGELPPKLPPSHNQSLTNIEQTRHRPDTQTSTTHNQKCTLGNNDKDSHHDKGRLTAAP